ncbi:MAG: iron ABC transporter substrate-binding protein [Pseudomonadota bacterium]
MIDRRALLAALAAGACSPRPAEPSAGAAGPVLAAGQPAALLIWALAPERLIGWPRQPSASGLALLPPAAASLPETGALAGGGAPMSLEAAAALRPDFILDYGDRDAADLDLAERIHRRIGRPYYLIDGDLMRMPDALREAGQLLGVKARGEQFADMAERLITEWQRPRQSGPAFYYARGADGLETAFRGALATEVLEGGAWRNVAVGGRDIGRVSREQVVAWDPEAVVTLDRRFAESAADDPVWRRRPDGSRRRLTLLPDQPFGWIDRPPSVNRLLGVHWAAFGDRAPAGIAALMGDLYGRVPTATELADLTPRDIP